MTNLYLGSDNACNFMWEEDLDEDRCRMIDWDMDENMIQAHIDEFKTNGLSENEYGDWRDGRTAIRDEMNGFTLVA